MAKNRQKNKGGYQVTQATTVNSASNQPTIVVKPANEILTTEEGEQLLKDSLAEMKEYCAKQKEEADRYYEQHRLDAEEKIKRESEKAAADRRQEIEREMKKDVDSAKEKAKAIEKESQEKSDALSQRQQDLDAKCEEYTKEAAALEVKKTTYKQEVLDSIKSEMDSIISERKKQEEENTRLINDIRKKDKDIAALEEDKAFYEEQLSINVVKKAEILSYQTRIDELNANYNKLEELYREQQERLSALTNQILLYGNDPQKALKDNAELKKKNKELQDLISGCPSVEELAKMRETCQRFEELSNKLDMANTEIARLEAENYDLKVSKDEIESYRRFIKILELQKAELQKELERNIELYNNSTEKVFANLSLIDQEPCNDYSPLQKTTLKQLCERFRGYLANRADAPLYYEERTIRTFIAGFSSSRLMILEGLSGTGKSSLPRAFQDFTGAKTIEVPVQSSWKDRNDLLGFYNDFKKQYKETEFLKALYRATHDPNNIYIIVLDEMNLSRIEYYFADLLSVLEKPKEEWKIELISDYAGITHNQGAWPKLIHEGKLQIGDNTWFVGTANKDDSTFMISDKVYDRSVVLSFDKKGEKGKTEFATPIKMNNEDFQKLLNAAKKFKDPKDDARFHAMIENLDHQVKEMFQITFGNRISNQLETFVPVYIECGGTVDEAVDVMFSRKVLRKLEGIYDKEIKINLDMLKDEIESKYKMPITVAAIERMVEKI